MGQELNAHLSIIENFIAETTRFSKPPVQVPRDLSDGCSGLAECASLAAADRESSQFLQRFLTEAEKGVWGYLSMARQSVAAYQNAGETAAWEVTNRTTPGEGIKPFEGSSPTALGPSPLATGAVSDQPPATSWQEMFPR